MIKFFQALGIVMTLMIAIALTLIFVYVSYILGIGLMIASLIYIVYQSLKLAENPK